jgi:hypothetical protein
MLRAALSEDLLSMLGDNASAAMINNHCRSPLRHLGDRRVKLAGAGRVASRRNRQSVEEDVRILATGRCFWSAPDVICSSGRSDGSKDRPCNRAIPG